MEIKSYHSSNNKLVASKIKISKSYGFTCCAAHCALMFVEGICLEEVIKPILDDWLKICVGKYPIIDY